MRPISSPKVQTMASPSNSKLTPVPPAIPHPMRSPWHSPVPYLFGGLAAMLGLIAFALLILACSYWRLSTGRRSNVQQGGVGSNDGDIESGGDEKEGKTAIDFEDKFLVIMAGDSKPTFLATPASNRAAYCGCGDEKGAAEKEGMKMENDEKVKRESDEDGETAITVTSEAVEEEEESEAAAARGVHVEGQN